MPTPTASPLCLPLPRHPPIIHLTFRYRKLSSIMGFPGSMAQARPLRGPALPSCPLVGL
jgi:hypothetical protein